MDAPKSDFEGTWTWWRIGYRKTDTLPIDVKKMKILGLYFFIIVFFQLKK
jgi:hypothetical protein